MFTFSFGPFIGFWLAFEAAARMGCLCLPGGGLHSAARLRAILDHRVTVLCCAPSYAIRLAEIAAEQRIDLRASRVKVIVVAGEAGGSIPATRARIQELWPGARVFDHHGMTEVGPVTFECPARPGVLHVMEQAFIPEIIDPATGKAVTPGDVGELVLTTLGRSASPVIRYRTGDLVKAAPEVPCACGRSDVALEGGILGRADDMVVVRGVNLFPSAIEQIVREHGGVAEYRVRLSARGPLTELRLEVEPRPDGSEGATVAGELERALQAAFALRIPVAAVPPGSLPRFEMKAKRWIKE
jgi:phenylacetate-CoA ligase